MTSHQEKKPSRRQVLAAGSAGAIGASAPGLVLAQSPAPAPSAAPVRAAPPASAALAARAVEAAREPILRISREVWANPEVAFNESKSAAIHVRELQAAGFRVSVGTSGIPTAFLAEWSQGTGGPVIAYLPEYDALPGLGNAAEPRQTPAPGNPVFGHGCGHNMLGAGCTGGAIALKGIMEQQRTPGVIRVFGCCAEEGGAAKVYFVRDGLFKDVDAALAWHPAPIAGVGAVSTSANISLKVRFNGRTAHAGNTPWDGRSALKAAELFGHGVNLMREHIRPTARLHYVYESAGLAPNIVPDVAQIWITMREKDWKTVSALRDWIIDVAKGAALATQTKEEIFFSAGMHELLPNDALISMLHGHLNATPLDWSAEEQAFARAIQKASGLPEKGMATRVLPVIGEVAAGGSSDLGDISFVTPLGVFIWPTLPLDVSLHTWGVTACGGMSIGDKASLATARILAGAGHDLMTSKELRDKAKADLVRRRGDYAYVSPIPPDVKTPPGIPAFMLKTGDDDFVSPLRTLGG